MSCTIALAGQPNTGKSTIFNRLTGAHQHVGNWPGKTVEQKRGHFTHAGRDYEIVDLPGTYSLSANSLEEIIARDFILEGGPDLVVTVVDASQLERSLYLLSEIVLLRTPVVVALNMMDVAGDRIDVAEFEKRLGVRVIPMTASKGVGLAELVDAIALAPHALVTLPSHNGMREPVERIRGLVEGITTCPAEWLAVKALENDALVKRLLQEQLAPDRWQAVCAVCESQPDGALKIAGERYGWIRTVIGNGSEGVRPYKPGRFDRLATHHIWGMPLAVTTLLLMFVVAMLVGGMPAMATFAVLPQIQAGVYGWLGENMLGAMVSDGLVIGVGMALSMTFFLVGMFLVIGLVEDVGYMARLAYVSDRFMQRLGLQGKSFMPMVMSLGCNVSGVSATRVIDSWRQRLITIILVPIVPCMALWGTVSFIGMIFFRERLPLVILAMLLSVMLVIVLTSMLLRRKVLPGDPTGLIMELPPYHRPNWRTIGAYVWINTKSFIRRGGTLIAAVSLAIWFFSYMPHGAIDTSWMASAGRFMEPFGALMGMDWRLLVCLVTGIASKEAALATMGVIFAGSQASSITGMITAQTVQSGLSDILAASISPATALAFLFAMLFSLPCIGTMGAMYNETKSLKWTLGAALYYTAVSLLAGMAAYQVGLLVL